ncbi:MAG: glycoside hydrolase family 25 protein [Lachnospiraceae bacterium]|nr:glycoside hydrolase family 25 protein [Lachnospiraceae bacterium]
MEEKKKKPIFNIIIVIMLIMTLACNGFMIYKLVKNDSKETGEVVEANADANLVYSEEEIKNIAAICMENGYDKGYDTLLEAIKEGLLSGNGVNPTLRKIFKDDIVYTYEGEYVFEPINKEFPLNTLNKDKFIVNDKDLSTYTVTYRDGDFESFKGIDVSKFQGDIDWEAVAASGIDFSFVRVGYRGYETGVIKEDEKARQNLEGSLNNGIKTGVYFYTQAINEAEAIEEADFVIDILKDYDINYPVAFDLEKVNDDIARTKNLTKEERVKIVQAFCERIKEAGYTPMLYGNLATMFSMVDYEEVADYEKWFAYYDYELYFPYELAIWQYSCTGIVEGIEGECDLNIAFKDLTTK